MKFNLFFIAAFILSQTIHAQITKGIIMPKEGNSLDFCCAYIPTTGIHIYDKPNGEILGEIIQEPRKDDHNKPRKVLLVLKNKANPTEYLTEEIIGDKIKALEYIDRHSNFVKAQSGYWIKESELEDKGLRTVNWMEYLIEKSPDVIGYYAKAPGLHLKEKPSEQSELILDLKGDLTEIKLTNEVKGLWCKVIVTKYSDHPCTSKGNFDEIKLKTYTGWIKLLSDDLIPNVTFYKSC